MCMFVNMSVYRISVCVCEVTASFISPLPGRGVSLSYRARLQRDAPSFPNLCLPPRYATLIKTGPALTATAKSLIQIPVM